MYIEQVCFASAVHDETWRALYEKAGLGADTSARRHVWLLNLEFNSSWPFQMYCLL